MEKTEILKKNLGDEDFYDLNGTKILQKILNSMEEYVKTKSIESKQHNETSQICLSCNKSDMIKKVGDFKICKRCW